MRGFIMLVVVAVIGGIIGAVSAQRRNTYSAGGVRR